MDIYENLQHPLLFGPGVWRHRYISGSQSSCEINSPQRGQSGRLGNCNCVIFLHNGTHNHFHIKTKNILAAQLDSLRGKPVNYIAAITFYVWKITFRYYRVSTWNMSRQHLISSKRRVFFLINYSRSLIWGKHGGALHILSRGLRYDMMQLFPCILLPF